MKISGNEREYQRTFDSRASKVCIVRGSSITLSIVSLREVVVQINKDAYLARPLGMRPMVRVSRRASCSARSESSGNGSIQRRSERARPPSSRCTYYHCQCFAVAKIYEAILTDLLQCATRSRGCLFKLAAGESGFAHCAPLSSLRSPRTLPTPQTRREGHGFRVNWRREVNERRWCGRQSPVNLEDSCAVARGTRHLNSAPCWHSNRAWTDHGRDSSNPGRTIGNVVANPHIRA